VITESLKLLSNAKTRAANVWLRLTVLLKKQNASWDLDCVWPRDSKDVQCSAYLRWQCVWWVPTATQWPRWNVWWTSSRVQRNTATVWKKHSNPTWWQSNSLMSVRLITESSRSSKNAKMRAVNVLQTHMAPLKKQNVLCNSVCVLPPNCKDASLSVFQSWLSAWWEPMETLSPLWSASWIWSHVQKNIAMWKKNSLQCPTMTSLRNWRSARKRMTNAWWMQQASKRKLNVIWPTVCASVVTSDPVPDLVFQAQQCVCWQPTVTGPRCWDVVCSLSLAQRSPVPVKNFSWKMISNPLCWPLTWHILMRPTTVSLKSSKSAKMPVVNVSQMLMVPSKKQNVLCNSECVLPQNCLDVLLSVFRSWPSAWWELMEILSPLWNVPWIWSHVQKNIAMWKLMISNLLLWPLKLLILERLTTESLKLSKSVKMQAVNVLPMLMVPSKKQNVLCNSVCVLPPNCLDVLLSVFQSWPSAWWEPTEILSPLWSVQWIWSPVPKNIAMLKKKSLQLQTVMLSRNWKSAKKPMINAWEQLRVWKTKLSVTWLMVCASVKISPSVLDRVYRRVPCVWWELWATTRRWSCAVCSSSTVHAKSAWRVTSKKRMRMLPSLSPYRVLTLERPTTVSLKSSRSVKPLSDSVFPKHRILWRKPNAFWSLDCVSPRDSKVAQSASLVWQCV